MTQNIFTRAASELLARNSRKGLRGRAREFWFHYRAYCRSWIDGEPNSKLQTYPGGNAAMREIIELAGTYPTECK